jgi:NAD(P)-dependent dehydrogenase (short-subunit alcohol dehydrogenase family)
VWAQGANAAGSIWDDGPAQMLDLFEANVLYVVDTLKLLLDAAAFAPGARVVVVSSVWQNVARDSKLAYATSKAAVAGLVRSLVADLGPLGISVNAVLPGVVDTPMTRQFLSSEQIQGLEAETPIGRLVSPEEVAQACVWLSSPLSSGISGQFLAVDGGWSGVRRV